MAAPTRPRLKQGETPQSESFKKRMRAFNRAVALAEVTKAKAEQDVREAEERAGRDVLSEVSGEPSKKPEAAADSSKKDDSRKQRVAGSARTALEDRAATIEEAIEGGIQEANKDTKRKK